MTINNATPYAAEDVTAFPLTPHSYAVMSGNVGSSFPVWTDDDGIEYHVALIWEAHDKDGNDVTSHDQLGSIIGEISAVVTNA